MAKDTTLIKRDGEYFIQANVPTDLIDEMGGKFLEIPLETTNSTIAHDRYFIEKLNLERTLREKRYQREAVDLNNAFAQDIRKICMKLFQENLRYFLAHKSIKKSQKKEAWEKGLYKNEWEDKLSSKTKQILSKNGITFPNDSASFVLSRRLFARAILSAYSTSESLKYDDTDAELGLKSSALQTNDPGEPNSNSHQIKNHETNSNDITVGEMLDLYYQEKSPTWHRDDVIYVFRFAEKIFKEIIGEHRLIRTITRKDGIKIKNTIANLPKRVGHLFPDLTLVESAQKAKDQDLPKLAKTTIESRLIIIRAILNWAVNGLYLEANPFLKLEAFKKRYTLDKGGRRAFTLEELSAIFFAPIYLGCKSPVQIHKCWKMFIRDRRFWSPLLGLLTGMRIGEICQLEVGDIQMHAGINVISVNSESALQFNTGGKTLKTQSASRYVPIHPELIKIGFLEFVNEKRERKEIRLFNRSKNNTNANDVKSFSSFFKRFLEHNEITGRKVVFHSFRHNFRDALREGNISLEIVWKLGGWSGGSGRTDAKYGMGVSIKSLKSAISKIKYPGLDLSHLYLEKNINK